MPQPFHELLGKMEEPFYVRMVDPMPPIVPNVPARAQTTTITQTKIVQADFCSRWHLVVSPDSPIHHEFQTQRPLVTSANATGN